MSTPVVAFFNNKGGVGKTSLVYHLGWMYAELDLTVVVADLDPQANLTAAFLEEDRLERLWSESAVKRATVFSCVEPLMTGTGDVPDEPPLQEMGEGLWLLPGDLSLARFEDELSATWSQCLDRNPRAFRVTTALWRTLQRAASQRNASLVLVDLGPNLGALNRAGLLAADHVVIPLGPDLFSLQGLRNLGPSLRSWRSGWQKRRDEAPRDLGFSLPEGSMEPAGYVVLQHAVRLDRPVRAYEQWVLRIPEVYYSSILERTAPAGSTFETDPECLAMLKHYRSLMPLAQEARKPMFALKPGDGAIGAHYAAAQQARRDFEALASKVAKAIGSMLPGSDRQPY